MGLWHHSNLSQWEFGPTGLWPYGNLDPEGFGPRALGLWPHGACPHGTFAPCDCSHVRLTMGKRLYGNLATFGPCWPLLASFGPWLPMLAHFGTMLVPFAPLCPFLFICLASFCTLFENNMPQLNRRSYAQILCLFKRSVDCAFSDAFHF